MTTNNLHLARTSLLGLSIGDALGNVISDKVNDRELREGCWLFTDDTVMGIGVYNILQRFGKINRDKLAKEFAVNYKADKNRHYGSSIQRVLEHIEGGCVG
jgi:ADP-ribosylglycohydrolase